MAKVFSKLNRNDMRRLETGQTITEHGISYRKLENGDAVFEVNIMVDGKRIHRVVGRETDGTTRTTAEAFINKVRQEAREGRLRLPKGRKVPMTLAAAVSLYIERLREEGGKEIERKRRRLDLYLAPFFGERLIDDITAFEIERYKKHRLSQPARGRMAGATGLSGGTNRPATVNRELATLSHLLSKAVEWGWIERPAVKIRKLKEENGRFTYLSAAQADAFLAAAKEDQNRQIYPFILIGLRTGMRKSEILSIRKEDIDLSARMIYVGKAKAGARLQPISAELVEFLSEYMRSLLDGCPWLFPSAGAKTGHTEVIRKPFMRVVAAAGLDPKQVTPHTLRHTAITHLVQAGVDLPTVKRISGHKTMAMVERYAHQSGPHIAEAMDRLDGRYGSTKKSN